MKQFSASPPEPGRIKELREMMTLVQRELLENRREQLLPLLVQHEEEYKERDGEATGMRRLSLTQIVNQAIEEYVMDSVSDVIWNCVRAAQTTDEASAIEVKRAALRQKPQEFFGIDEPNLSPSAWADAIAEVLNPNATEGPLNGVLVWDYFKEVLVVIRAKGNEVGRLTDDLNAKEQRREGKMLSAQCINSNLNICHNFC